MLSFDITDRNIRIIKGTENNGRIRISSAATLSLEEEVIVNGHVRDVARLATLINQVIRTNKMFDKEAIVSISSNMTIFKELHIAKPEKQQDLMKMVRAEMANALGIDDSYSVSYIVVGDSDQKEGFQKVLATACPYEVVDCYKRVFNMLQINLRSVMIGCNCITKVLLSDTKVKSKMPLLAVQIDNNFISLNLYEDNQLSFSRFASISAEDYDDSEDYVFEAVQENINRMLMFQRSKSGSDPIENVVFYGDTHEYVRLTSELEKQGIRTSIITVPPQIHGYENLEFSSYANAVGAMFKRNKDSERINLLETDTVNNNKIKSDSSYIALLVGAVVGAAVICGGVYGVYWAKNRSVEKQMEVIKQKQECQLTQDLKDQLVMLEDKQKAVNTYLDGVKSAYNAYVSRPAPLSKHYEEIQETIEKVIIDTLEDADEDNVKDFYKITSFQYSAGVYDVQLISLCESDLPLPELPSKVIRALRDLNDVEDIPYSGYAFESVDEFEQFKGTNDEGEEVDLVAMEDIRAIGINMSIFMRGGDVDIDSLETEEAE